MTTLPKIALASPPAEPGGGVICVNSVGDSAAKPLPNSTPRIQSRKTMPKAIARHRQSARLNRLTSSAAGGSSRVVVMPAPLMSSCPRPWRAGRSASASSASTMNVRTNSTSPSAISDARCIGSAASLNSLASAEAIELPGSNSDGADLVRVADDEGDGHRLAQRAAEAQHDAADHADLGVGQHDVPDHLPGRRSRCRTPTPSAPAARSRTRRASPRR